MSFLSTLRQAFTHPARAIPILGDVIDVIGQLEDSGQKIVQDVQAAILEFQRFRHRDGSWFDFNPQWKTRVTSIPRAWEGIQELFGIILHGFQDKFRELETAIRGIVGIFRNFKNIAPAPGSDESAIGNIESNLATIPIGLQNLETAIHTILDLERMMLDIRDRLERLDDLFLPSGSRKTVVTVHYRKRNA